MEPGYYAVCISCITHSVEMSHPTSLLIEKVHLMTHKNGIFKGQTELCIFPVDSIESTCIAAPFCAKQNIMNALEWSILRPRSTWNSILTDFLKHGYESDTD